MSNIAAPDKKSSDIKLLSKTETMQMVFDDLRSNRPKPLESHNSRLQLHKRSMSLPNTDSLTIPRPMHLQRSVGNLRPI
ncbi:unnamed protein product [Macrosiphum euphorbiae]|uniref:Uncharacterized protein n=1 Tax=Macrosiphum euphorbiae TaxID=13131 RepID=A0AAV0WZ23_9HEMI|nr:unnamed protein product [Macrosiphum euphorbiae]